MSRYRIHTLNSDRHETFVGWDNPLQTYFAQVYDLSASDEDDSISFWVGEKPQEVTSVDVLEEKVRPFAVIPQEIKEKLLRDYQERTQPTPLQRMMSELFRNIKDNNES